MTKLAKQAKQLIKLFPKIYPGAHCELDFKNPLQLLVATILSAQCTDKRVNLVTPRLFAKYKSAAAFASAIPGKLEDDIRSTGFFRNKARSIRAAAAAIEKDHQGRVPETMEELRQLPGVGRKTANVVLNTAFREPTIGVDTHVFRVANRTGIAPGPDALAVELKLERLVPEQYKLHAHHWLILHGRYVCVARRPKCPQCLMVDICRYPDKTPPVPAAAS